MRRKEKEPAGMIGIRKAFDADIAAITEIYNQAVLHTTATFDTEPKSVAAQREWFRKHGDTHPVLVAEGGTGIVGWASLSPWSDRCAYDSTVELSIYIAEADRGKGIGKMLLGALLARARGLDLHTIIARVAGGNEASRRLHEQAGFRLIGTMREVGYKFGRFLDVEIYQLMLKG